MVDFAVVAATLSEKCWNLHEKFFVSKPHVSQIQECR